MKSSEFAAEQTNTSELQRFSKLVKRVVAFGSITLGASMVNDFYVQHTPVGFSQMIMEGVDVALPVTLDKANGADSIQKHKKAIAWRSVSNVAHIGAGIWGTVEAATFIDKNPSYDAKSIALSAVVGLWNLGIINTIRRQRSNARMHHHERVQLQEIDVVFPPSAEDVMLEDHHTHPNISKRNLENLEMCAQSNIVEALPAFAGPLVQMGWENGSAATVIASNAVVVAMAARQLYKDVKLAAHLPS